MSIFTHESMTNHHASGVLNQVGETLHVWWDRYERRRELAHWSDRDLHDIGMSRSDIVFEIDKPFWRA
ncbi:hypothetical protein UP10_27790 [Bradyrhizobium sp. LTSPM299]|uniref:DUF1127 domain-containing protein n=1 Tax=unclassified Bradyrhizobium TaxID=2631580 RepID=UPI0005C935D2|nr:MULTISPECIES: DUF1127 domain-containing protein [unclassified Bradyrhizobium]KJC33514.1 hypothetical protein UP09_34015 [Bradyrhizobium sp. LTSP885]KJC57650.1 hypothetical protein UP10_27790 [Bradyrhizobium sp. LTSPM299]